MARTDKTDAVAELAEEFRSSAGAVLTEYRGLSVKQLQDLRRSLGGNAKFAIVKNTLTKIAARDAGVEGFEDLLVGPSAIAFIKGDPVETAKSLRDFARANAPLVVKGGVLDQRPLSVEEIARLADLESREVLLSKLAGALLASLQNAASLFQAPLSQAARLAGALQAEREQQVGAAEAVAEPADSSGAGNSDAVAGDSEPTADPAPPDSDTPDQTPEG